MKLSPEQKHAITEILKFPKDVQTLGGFAGTGKAQKLDALVYTPFGPKKMGDIEVGDRVSNPGGGVATVIGVFPQGKLPVYKVSFIDGGSTIVSGDHLWRVKISSKKYKAKKSMLDGTGEVLKEEIATTDYLREYLKKNKQRSRPRYPLVPLAKPVQFMVDTELLMNPYLLGLLIGDGGLIGSLTFTTADDFLCEQMKNIVDDEHDFHPVKSSRYDFTIVKKPNNKHNKYKDALRHYGLFGKRSHEKFIPDVYKLSTLETRWAIVQGLMDTDGTVDEYNAASYSTTSKQLSEDVQWLVRSLGGKATISEKYPTYTHNGEKKTGRLAYDLYIQIPDKSRLFRLPRKKERCVDQFNGGFSVLRNRMVSIEPAGAEYCQCIQVDNPNSLYITDDFIVTHNTTVISHIVRAKPTFAVCAFTGKAANVLRKKGVRATTIHSLIYHIRKGEDGKSELDDHGNPIWELKPSLDAEGIICDEASMVSEDIYQDLLSFGLPVIFVGDHGQLEPVQGNFNLMQIPDYTLEEIHRNAGDIARFAEWIRMGYLPAAFERQVRSNNVIFLNKWQMGQYLDQVDQIICAFNQTRVEMNVQVRKKLGFYTQGPEVNDRVMCLRNNNKIGLFNGMQGKINYLFHKNKMQFKSDDDRNYDVKFDKSAFGKARPEISRNRDDPDPFDWCYVVTCHKAQGDEWDKTMVIEQRSNQWDHRRWGYTAASRAKEFLAWVAK